MELTLTQQEKDITANLLNQISVPVKDAPIVLEIIRKLQIKEDKKA